MLYKDIFWMACDSTEQLRAEYGPFHTREEAEVEARKLGFGYLLRYEHILGPDEEIEEVRCVFLELQDMQTAPMPGVTFHTRCATCGGPRRTWTRFRFASSGGSPVSRGGARS